MSQERKQQILNAIVEHFIKTAQPVGSKTILVAYKFDVSPATVRNDMALLEDEGFITQPHTSAGRIPTDKGYRIYVDELADFSIAKKMAQKTLAQIINQNSTERAKQKVQSAVGLLGKASPNLAFATIPENDKTFFMGFSKMLKQPEFLESPMQACQVIELIEDRQTFIKSIQTIPDSPEVQIFIGKENVLQGIESCSMIITSYTVDGYTGSIGILGPKRMPYAFNSAILTEVRNLLESNQL